MTKDELAVAIIPYLDINGLVKPKAEVQDSDNGVLFTSILQILTGVPYQQKAIDSCYLEPGLLARKPKGVNSQQEQFDDVLGRAVCGIVSGETKECRQILWYGIRHGGFYNTDNDLEGKDFLWRFFFVFCFVFAAAFPFLKRLVQIPLAFNVNNFNPSTLADSSGLQLQWLQCIAFDKLYNTNNDCFKSWYLNYQYNTGAKLSDMFSTYYESEHPFVEFVRTNLDEQK